MSIADLKVIHTAVFNKFKYKTDQESHGTIEHWNVPDEFAQGKVFTGDCEEFAMACRMLCREKGIVSQLAVCIDETGEYHCVLHVNGYILDNRHDSVKTTDELSKLGYKWIAISGDNVGDQWYKVAT